MKNVAALILAGGAWSSLGILAERRAKAAIPFGGMYRIIDFVLSNLMHSDIEQVGILTQYRPGSLIDHVGIGASWDLFGRTRGVKILSPYKGQKDSDWYKGTADAVYQNLSFVRSRRPEYVLLLAGENIYHLDYRDVIRYHEEKHADCTLVCNKLPAPNPQRFGIMSLDTDGRVVNYQEKPAAITGDYYSASIYVFSTDFLLSKLAADAARRTSKHNFADDIIPDMLKCQDKFYGYPHNGYWAYCGTVEEYWQANMDLLEETSPIDLAHWNLRTNLEDRNVADHQPALILPTATVTQAMVSSGCTVGGRIEHSILSPGVIVEEGAVVRNSLIFHECVIKKGAMLDKVIADKDVVIGAGTQIGISEEALPNEEFPEYFHAGMTVLGKAAKIGNNSHIGKNCLIYPEVAVPDGVGISTGSVVR